MLIMGIPLGGGGLFCFGLRGGKVEHKTRSGPTGSLLAIRDFLKSYQQPMDFEPFWFERLEWRTPRGLNGKKMIGRFFLK